MKLFFQVLSVLKDFFIFLNFIWNSNIGRVNIFKIFLLYKNGWIVVVYILEVLLGSRISGGMNFWHIMEIFFYHITVLNGQPRPLTCNHRGSQKAEKGGRLHGLARPNLRGEEDSSRNGEWEGDGRRDEDAVGKQPCILVPAVWSGWRRPCSFKGQARAAGLGGAGTLEAAPPRLALTSWNGLQGRWRT